MNKLLEKIRRYPISSFYIVIIWILCFCTPPHTPLDNVSMIDKWTHIAMYLGTCSTIWIEYERSHRPSSAFAGEWKINWQRLLIWAWLAPALMSGLIEVLQANCTGGRRSGEWLDFAANSIGCTLALAFGVIYLKVKRGRENR